MVSILVQIGQAEVCFYTSPRVFFLVCYLLIILESYDFAFFVGINKENNNNKKKEPPRFSI